MKKLEAWFEKEIDDAVLTAIVETLIEHDVKFYVYEDVVSLSEVERQKEFFERAREMFRNLHPIGCPYRVLYDERCMFSEPLHYCGESGRQNKEGYCKTFRVLWDENGHMNKKEKS
jgi:hypothetical protein